MNNTFKTLVVLAILAIAGSSFAQTQANANANATIICQLKIVNNTTLEFGTIVNSGTGGTYTVNSNGSVDVPTGGISHYAGGPATHPADFTVTGDDALTYNTVTTTVAGWTGTGVTWDATPTNTTTVGGNATGTLVGGEGGCGTGDVKVGGTIDVSLTAHGSYTGMVNVAVAYN